jgi:7-cyano-7-deazaguanine synthase
MDLKQILASLPESNGAVAILSGGMDSTVSMRLAVEKYGAKNISALTFFYGQKQAYEIEMARESTSILGVKHKVLDIRFLGEIAKGFSANTDPDMVMPTIKDILGLPVPPTYVPNRNMILMSIAAAYAEVQKIPIIIAGFEAVDSFGYSDTTPPFVAAVNHCFTYNRSILIKVIAPFNNLTKRDEIRILKELDGNVDLLKHTLTCYNPQPKVYNLQPPIQVFRSCGKCPSCSERKKAFLDEETPDPALI